MTPAQKDTIKKIKAEQSHYYMQQRVTPHYIEAYPEATIVFQQYNLQQEPWATYTDTEDLLKEVDEVLRTKGNKRDNLAPIPTTGSVTADATAPPAAGRGKGKRLGNAWPQHRPGNTKYPRTDNTPTQGSSSVENTGSGKGKSWHTLTNENIYFEHKGKGKGYCTGHRYSGNTVGTGVQTPSNVPSLTTSSIQLFTLMDLEHPGSANCPFKSVPYKTPTANRFMHEPIRVLPKIAWLKPKLDLPKAMITDNHQRTYLHALECISKASHSVVLWTGHSRQGYWWLDQLWRPICASAWSTPIHHATSPTAWIRPVRRFDTSAKVQTTCTDQVRTQTRGPRVHT